MLLTLRPKLLKEKKNKDPVVTSVKVKNKDTPLGPKAMPPEIKTLVSRQVAVAALRSRLLHCENYTVSFHS